MRTTPAIETPFSWHGRAPVLVGLLLLLASCGSPGGSETGGGGGDGPSADGTCMTQPYDPGDPEAGVSDEPDPDCTPSADPGGLYDGVAGCGPGPTPDGVTSWEECPDDPGGPRYQLVEPQEGLVDPRPVDWLKAKPREGGTVLRITFWSGVEECYGVAEIVTDEGPDEVVVTIIEGRNPDAEVCIDLAVKKAVDVELDAPLGGRKVRDGAG